MFNATPDTVFSVSKLNQAVASLLEDSFAWIWVEGEISNLATPASGHIYFSLKDARAQIRCAMFRGRNRTLNFRPENGQQIRVRAKVSLYQPRGDYQLIVDRMEEAGDGALRRQFELLKQQLAGEGLFDEAAKQEIPALPACIGIITSGTGAAIHDVLSVIERRFPSIAVKLIPVPVQGSEAAPAICRALTLLAETGDCDVILLVRGGGSLEDLWAFNEESVARAIYDCPLPVVSGIGHEVDVTIADFVADIRAATPTAAAETVTPDQQTWLQSFDWYQQRLAQLMQEKIQRGREKTAWLEKRLQQQHPESILQRAAERCHEMHNRLLRAWQYSLAEKRARLKQLQSQFMAHHPGAQLQQRQQTLHYTRRRLYSGIQQILTEKKNRLGNCARTLQAISPLKTLDRGYSITLAPDKTAVTSIKQLKPGDNIETRLHQGSILSRVEKLTP